MSKEKLNLQVILSKLSGMFGKVRRYSLLIFIVFVALLYGFVAYKINSLAGAEPSSSDVTSQVNAAQVPRIDPAVVKQLQSLQDNSVSVQSLFDQARSNPFQ
jgi:hypothetical protein